MSGFAGWVDLQRDLTTQKDVVATMTDALRRRGPDGSGLWVSPTAALGHCRLAAEHRAGVQPALLDDRAGTLAIVCDGQIYNRDELRRQLEPAAGPPACDADLLLRCYRRWGAGFVERLDGMFAFALWDARERRLLLGRDRLGVKPLYYFAHADGILFASEPKAILANPLFEPRLDLSMLSMLLQPRLALPGETPLAGLRELPRAHAAAYSADSGLVLRRYWQLASAPHGESFEQTVRHVRGLLEDVVQRQLGNGSRPPAVGTMLSGGIDSTSVAALTMHALRAEGAQGSLGTFCLDFRSERADFVPTELRPEVDAPYAQQAAQFIGSRHETIRVDASGVLEIIPETRRARDLPGWGQFDGSTYLLFREMRRHCPVALTGEVADELFGGYPYFFNPQLIRRDHFPWLEDGPKLSDYLHAAIRTHFDPRKDEYARYRQWLADAPRLAGEAPEDRRMREIFYLTISGRLSVLLDRMDRMSARVGLEIRLPFCDHGLLGYLWNVPWSMKAHGGMKGLLKEAVRDVVPASTIERRKSAFPHIQNADYDGALIREARAIVDDERSASAALFDRPKLKGLIDGLAAEPAGLNAAHVLIHLVEVHRWIEDYKVSLR
jgi:asparagine synthase (glutamine-hydrolysing)